MSKPSSISIDQYDYDLPEERIARYPLANRDHSKLLIYHDGAISESLFLNLQDHLQDGDRLYFNTTRVIQARLKFFKPTGARIEIFCLEPAYPSDYQLSFASSGPVTWTCLLGNAKKWKEGILTCQVKTGTETVKFTAEKTGKSGDKFLIRFSWDNAQFSFAELLEVAGSTPIPPYLKREPEDSDAGNYQTVYAEYNGSVAAPTAGLHFTEKMISGLKEEGINIEHLTLHVGAGTFIPVKTRNAVLHNMHAEMVTVSSVLLQNLLSDPGRKIAVGTTSVRSLESIYWIGVLLLENRVEDFQHLVLDQWSAYDADQNITLEDSINRVLEELKMREMETYSFQTRIMITPGYQFRVIDGLITNFHQPKSTLLLLIAALVGDDWKEIYQYAREHSFRFLSYGDSSLIIRQSSR